MRGGSTGRGVASCWGVGDAPNLGSILLGLDDSRAPSLAIGQARHIGHGRHVCNEVGLVLAGGHQGVMHILLIKQQPLWHLLHACSTAHGTGVTGRTGMQVELLAQSKRDYCG